MYGLVGRELRNFYRDTNTLFGSFGLTVFLGLLLGLVFMDAGSRGNKDQEDFNGHLGALGMVMILSLYMSSMNVMMVYPYERTMFFREYSTGTCKEK